MADEAKPSKSKEVLGGKKEEPTLRELRKMSIERTTNGHIKATHDYGDDKPEIHALPNSGFLGHLRSAFNLSEEKKALEAKRANVEAYEREHGSLTKPVVGMVRPASTDIYEKIRSDVREKAKRPTAPTSELLDRAEALIKGR